MTIKEMPHTTVEQVLALRDTAIKLEDQNHKLKTRLRAMQECAQESQKLDWNTDSDDEEMERLYFYANADHSDVLGENK